MVLPSKNNLGLILTKWLRLGISAFCLDYTLLRVPLKWKKDGHVILIPRLSLMENLVPKFRTVFWAMSALSLSPVTTAQNWNTEILFWCFWFILHFITFVYPWRRSFHVIHLLMLRESSAHIHKTYFPYRRRANRYDRNTAINWKLKASKNLLFIGNRMLRNIAIRWQLDVTKTLPFNVD